MRVRSEIRRVREVPRDPRIVTALRNAAIRGTRKRIKRNKIKCKRALLGGVRFYFRLNSEARPIFLPPPSPHVRHLHHHHLRHQLLLHHSPRRRRSPYLVSESKLFSPPCRGRFYHRADGFPCNPRYTASRFPRPPRRYPTRVRKTRSTSVYLFRDAHGATVGCDSRARQRTVAVAGEIAYVKTCERAERS